LRALAAAPSFHALDFPMNNPRFANWPSGLELAEWGARMRLKKYSKAKTIAYRKRLAHADIEANDEITPDQRVARHLILELAGRIFPRNIPVTLPVRQRRQARKIKLFGPVL
jgi:hypothetical protein